MARKSRIVIGLNSGTSADGVDAVACAISGRGLALRARVLGHLQRSYSPDLRGRLLAIMAPAATRTEELCRLDVEVGRAFAGAAAAVVRKLGLRRVDLIGSHGQTICHLPPVKGRGRADARGAVSATLQIGDAAIISEAMKCPVVHGFRQADMAAGGQGAPLVPWTDYVLFRHARKSRVIQNIGGIANLTWLPAGGRIEDTVAFDTGPGNMMIDALVRKFSRGRAEFDRGGRMAARGRVNNVVLGRLMGHPYLRISPPKSCGREQFGERYVEALVREFRRVRLSGEDWATTATHFSVACMVLGYAWLSDEGAGRFPPMDEIILCGGGARNATLVAQLSKCLSSGRRRVEVTTTDDYGVSTQAKEGLSFAMLAAACVDRAPANLPRVTGAKRRVVLGSICDMGGAR